MTFPTEYPLAGNTLAWCERMMTQIAQLQTQMSGALALLCEQEGLAGNWALDWPARKLVRMDQQAAEETAVPAMQTNGREHA